MSYLDEVKEKKSQKASQQGRDQFAQAFVGFANSLDALTSSLPVAQMKKLDRELIDAIKSLSEVAKDIKSVKVMGDDGVKTALKTIAVLLKANKPVINLPETVVNVEKTEVDLKPLMGAFRKLAEKIEGSKTVIPETDLTSVEQGLDKVRKAISSLRFPASNYILPYKSAAGASAQVVLTSDGKVPVDATTTPSGTQDVNITEVGGNAVTTTIPVSGTVTANLSATDNTVLDNIDTNTSRLAISGIAHGVKTVTSAGSDEALAGSTACKRVTIQAQTDNTSVIAVGASGVDATVATGTGVLLFPGDVFELDIDNLADVFIDSLVNGEGVRFTYFN